MKLGERDASIEDLLLTAGVVHRLAVMLGAGVAPVTAWQHVGGAAPPRWVVKIAQEIRNDPASIPRVLSVARRVDPSCPAAVDALAAMWEIAASSGAPLADALRSLATELRSEAEARRVARLALTGPRATAKLVVLMPVVAVAFGMLLGYDTIGVLVGTTIGWSCAIGGTLLIIGGARWSNRLARRAAAARAHPALATELLAIAVSGGVAPERAIAATRQALNSADLDDDLDRAIAIVELATAVGAPVTELLRADATEVRRDAAAAAMEGATRLETTLLLPLGVCVLPAFVLLGVVPLLVAVMSSTIASL